MTVLGSPGVKGRYLGSEPDSSNGVHQVFVVFTKVPIHGISVMQRPAEAMMEPKAPTYGIRGAASPPKVTAYGGGSHARGTKGPQIWDAEPGWYGLMPPQRSPSMGCAACQKYERTPDMGHVPGPGRPDAPKGHHLWGGVSAQRHREARGSKVVIGVGTERFG